MSKIKEFMAKPITYGAYFKWCVASCGVALIYLYKVMRDLAKIE